LSTEGETRLRRGRFVYGMEGLVYKGEDLSTEGKICLRRGRFVYGMGGLVYGGEDSSKKGRGDKGQVQYQLVASHQVYACIFLRKTYILASMKDKGTEDTLIKKKIKFSSYIRKFRMEQLQSHI
jgi:hypothetical protein